MVREALLDRIGAAEQNVHPVPVNVDDPASAAMAYEKTLREHFSGENRPAWDLALLGMGDDAHTASLFPGTAALDVQERWFVENWVEKFNAFRYTLTAPAINSAKQSWFLVAGSGKREALSHVLDGTTNHRLFPSQLIRPTRWLVTKDAWSGE
jgi:6-phosphogluconolactonase